MSSSNSDSESKPPSATTSKRMESEGRGIKALLAQVPKSLSQSDVSDHSTPSHHSDDDDAQSDRKTTVAKNKAKGKIIFSFLFFILFLTNN